MPPMGQPLRIRAISAWNAIENRSLFACFLSFFYGIDPIALVRAIQKATAVAEFMETVLRNLQDRSFPLLAHGHPVLHRTTDRHGYDRFPLR